MYWVEPTDKTQNKLYFKESLSIRPLSSKLWVLLVLTARLLALVNLGEELL